MQHATRYHTAMLEQAPWVVEQGRCDLELALQYEQQENLHGSSISVAPEDHHHSMPSSFQILPCQVNTQEKGMKFALPNSLMHDTDEHNFYVWQPHCRRMEYVRKMLSRRHFNKLEAMQSRHHMKDPTKITLPSQMCLIISGTSTNQRQYMFEMICKMQPILHCQLEGVSSEVIDEGYTRKVV